MSKIHERRISMWLILGLGALVRFVNLGYQSYSMDELWELSIVNLPAGEIVTAGDGFPPLFHLIFRGLLVGGFSDFIGRVFAAVLGVATIWLAARLGRRFSRSVGTGTALAVALAPLLVLLSKEGRAYGLYILLAALLLLATWEAIHADTAVAWAFFAAIAVLGMYTHFMFAFAIASSETVILLNMRQLKSWRGFVAAHAAILVLLVPLVLIASADFALDAASKDTRAVDLTAIAYAGFSLITGFTLGPSTRDLHEMAAPEAIRGALPWAIPILLAAGYLGYRGWKAMTAEWRIKLGVPIVATPLLLTLSSIIVGVAFRVRYLSWLVLPMAVWLAIGYTQSRGKLRVAAALTLVVVAIAAMIGRVTVEEHRVEDARAAAEYVQSGAAMPTVATAWYMARPVEYYLDPVQATVLPPGEGAERFRYGPFPNNRIVPIPAVKADESTLIAALKVFEEAVDVDEEYRLIYTRPFHGDVDRAFLNLRTEQDGLVEVASYAGVKIYEGRRAD